MHLHLHRWKNSNHQSRCLNNHAYQLMLLAYAYLVFFALTRDHMTLIFSYAFSKASNWLQWQLQGCVAISNGLFFAKGPLFLFKQLDKRLCRHAGFHSDANTK
ncbi:hypothetical protein QVD17_29228 [Tagetes erecta]|uniref:Uncharacterized protein n=1 Tax=Tagetes erecta TaxID=13708 RepID=A0AAD8KBV6_TARER|nr:hypothetical protein QVD17_29228 [Tagetes erecta]